MLFKRREKLPFYTRIISLIWPRRGPVRGARYVFHRLARLPGTSHGIAAGFASGAAVSFTPFLGLHFLLGFVVAFATRGNLFASAIGTFVGNPWTFPVFFAMAAGSGEMLLGQEANSAEVPAFSWSALTDQPLAYLQSFWDGLYPLIIGSVPNAVIAWLVFYGFFRMLLAGYRRKTNQPAAVNESP